MKTAKYFTWITGIFVLFVFAGCKNNQQPIQLKESSEDYIKPKTYKLAFGAPRKISWTYVHKDTVKTPEIRKIDIESLPATPLNAGIPRRLTKPPRVKSFIWNSLPDTAFTLDKIIATKPVFTVTKLGQPVRVKAGFPRLKDGATTSIFMFGQDQGLPGTVGQCFFKDRSGALWLGTDNGLCKYDGEYCTTYTISQGLADNWIVRGLQDRKGLIWISYQTGTTLEVLDPTAGTISHITTGGGLSGYPLGIIEDNAGRVWVSSFYGVDVFSGLDSVRSLGKAQGFMNNYTGSMIQDSKSRIWLTKPGFGVDVIDFNANHIIHLDSTNALFKRAISYVMEGNDGRIWVTSRANLVQVIDEQKETVSFFDECGFSNSCFDIAQDRQGRIYFATNGNGVEIFDGRDSSIKDITADQGLSNNIVRSLTNDQHGQIWIGTFGGELNIYDPNSTFQHYGSSNGLNNHSAFFYALAEDSRNRLWVSSLSEGMDIIDLRAGTIRNLPAAGNKAETFIAAMVMDGKDSIWMASNTSVSLFDLHTNSFHTYGNEQGIITSNFGGQIFLDRQKRLWLPRNGVQVLNTLTGEIRNLGRTEGLRSNSSIIDAEEDEKGTIWLGSRDAISLIDPQLNTISDMLDSATIGRLKLMMICRDSRGLMWIGTAGRGVFVFDPRTGLMENLTLKEGLADMFVLSMIERNGSMYAGTGKGLSVISPGKSVDGNIQWNINSFSKAQGLRRVDFNPVSMLAHDGNLWFGISDVLTRVSEIKSDSIVPKAQIVSLDIMDDQQDLLLPGLELPFDKNRLTFYFSGMHLADPDKTRYRYKLEGNDRDWSNITEKAFADYRNLSPGSYTFKVVSTSSNGKWSEPASYTFSILPPWWRTWWAYALYIIGAMAIIAGLIRWRTKSYEKEQKILEHKVKLRTTELRQSLDDLKSTQAQLVQSEKMASLGELTAGIAHEIQNPLNFINNFSEVSVELANEMDDDLKEGKIDSAKTLSSDIKQNMEKINFHGKRADAIVKNMLQHSRKGSDEKEPTDLNALVDEFMRLSYHGLRARDKSFNAALETNFDENVGNINIISQEVGRVLLNMFTNSFYSVMQKQKEISDGYEPTISVSTKRTGNKVEIRVRDNGKGIPQKVLDKIYQPFFTTKPTGEGTGLGLSLSYDIITKTHGGTLAVETKEGEYAEFIITLPTN